MILIQFTYCQIQCMHLQSFRCPFCMWAEKKSSQLWICKWRNKESTLNHQFGGWRFLQNRWLGPLIKKTFNSLNLSLFFFFTSIHISGIVKQVMIKSWSWWADNKGLDSQSKTESESSKASQSLTAHKWVSEVNGIEVDWSSWVCGKRMGWYGHDVGIRMNLAVLGLGVFL